MRAEADGESIVAPPPLTEDFIGLAVQYTSALLFIGYEIDGLVEITVYPRYRFSSDDRVHGHLGYVRVAFGTPWEEILEQVDAIVEQAERNYRLAVTLRSNAQQAGGARFDNAYHTITDLFRESWHGFALRLQREGEISKAGVVFSGAPPDPVLVTWRGDLFTLNVFPTGSILLVNGDQTRRLSQLIGR
ncbi:MAG TPA: hypothetical protein VLQ48_04210 [Chloroflexia bacterium]|nr:hypothetical protein [Chloroflexia bacterium]